jgi:hypothetical protein
MRTQQQPKHNSPPIGGASTGAAGFVVRGPGEYAGASNDELK